MKIILFQPDIPQNTGNIIRTCFLTNTDLIIVNPCSFALTDRYLKRAGLDYFYELNFQTIDNLEKYLEGKKNFYFFSSKATINYSHVKYQKDSILIFGSETSGLPLNLHGKYEKHFVKIPMKKNSRCLNLANSVSIGLYEALRQNNFIYL